VMRRGLDSALGGAKLTGPTQGIANRDAVSRLLVEKHAIESQLS
jgi:hypothetical protein